MVVMVVMVAAEAVVEDVAAVEAVGQAMDRSIISPHGRDRAGSMGGAPAGV